MAIVIEKPQAATTTAAKSRRKIATWTAIALFALVNVGLSRFSFLYQSPIEQVVTEPGAENNGHSKPWSWWLARRYLLQQKAPDVVLFGSSQMGAAVCSADAWHLQKTVDALLDRRVATLEDDLHTKLKEPVTVFNLASPGAMASDAFMASKALFKETLKPKLVVIGVSPRDFIDNTMPYPATTEPFKFYSQYVSPGKLTFCSYLDPMSWLQFGLDSVPCRKLGMFIQSKAASQSQTETPTKPVATALAAILGGGIAVPGAWRVPAYIPPSWINNTKEYKMRFRNPNAPVYQSERAFFNEFLLQMHARNIDVVVVGMPSLPMNRELLPPAFWSQFRANIAHKCSETGAQWLDLSADPDFIKSDYLDTVHLNAVGGLKFFTKLSDYIAGNAKLAHRLAANEVAEKPPADASQ